MPTRPACSLLAVLTALAPGSARADHVMPGYAEAIAQALDALNFHSQYQLGVSGVLADGSHSGGAELRGTFNVRGIGASLGGRFEPYPSGGQGGLGFATLEFRPIPYLEKNVFRVFDPFVTLGGELGGGSRGLRASQTIGAGLDLGLVTDINEKGGTVGPVIGLRYELRTLRTSSDLPAHLLHIGAGLRATFLAEREACGASPDSVRFARAGGHRRGATHSYGP